ncbi:hypothetical protein MG293_007223 [Ovis ammon polii]|uniref:Uncharacterized protein n=1 Tax=Ovis ammon polii TaxID=230172 RepID=A0AAD4UEF5_OVIAM|nr:hypothetical protein MG293_007223 [Ovis ammon polii]
MKLLQGTIFCLLLSNISSAEQNPETPSANTPLSTTSKATTISPTINTTTSPNDEKSTVEISTEGTSTKNITETKLSTTEATVMSQSLSSAVSTSQSSDSKINTSPPEASSFRTVTLSSISVTTPENISPSQGLENAKNASASTTSPSYSSEYHIYLHSMQFYFADGYCFDCNNTFSLRSGGFVSNVLEDRPRPQSDKESVKLLTVKTISHESGLLFSFNAPWGESPVESILTSNPACQSPVPVK